MGSRSGGSCGGAVALAFTALAAAPVVLAGLSALRQRHRIRGQEHLDDHGHASCRAIHKLQQRFGGPERGAITEWNGAIFKPRARRAKRTIDVAMALLVLLAFPVFIVRKQSDWLGAAVEVLIGTSTWVGYNNPSENRAHPANGFVFQRAEGMGERAGQRALLTYVRDYRWTIDVQVIWEALISYRAIHRHGSN